MKETISSSQVRRLVYQLENPHIKSLQKPSEPSVDREDVRKHMKLKWKDPGFCNFQFEKGNSLRGKLLTGWQISRICMAERSYITPKNSKAYKFDASSRQFPKIDLNGYPKKFQDHLKSIEAKNQDLMFKEKRAVTQSAWAQSTAKTTLKTSTSAFKPVFPQDKLFGFGSVQYYRTQFKSQKHKTINPRA